ncbi:MAG: hypothetical protein ACLU5I_07865 [Alistipes finegoldii]
MPKSRSWNTLTKQRKREVDQAKILIGNYKEQQNNVRNNREFDAITKEIEYQELEIELAEKRLKRVQRRREGQAPAGGGRSRSRRTRAADLAAREERAGGHRGRDHRWSPSSKCRPTAPKPRSTSACWQPAAVSARTSATDWPW